MRVKTRKGAWVTTNNPAKVARESGALSLELTGLELFKATAILGQAPAPGEITDKVVVNRIIKEW
jgi:hypothetical protein